MALPSNREWKFAATLWMTTVMEPLMRTAIPRKVAKVLPMRKVAKALPMRKVAKVLPMRKVAKALPMKKVAKVLPMRKVGKVLPMRKVGKVLLMRKGVSPPRAEMPRWLTIRQLRKVAILSGKRILRGVGPVTIPAPKKREPRLDLLEAAD